ncbi:dolichyl-diphosphooligosaccharide-protein glycosyltransferase [Phakopsora pachyrhizi]|uniref:Dolichyl-diphosphooligosaccharide--protein glycosyltransferase subunit STT3 n=1 Tax=Phakopsora pachyrhizi TaxID=170000 RepID=A0AAV0BVN7_PHAPC|nr:dolichyl-diphosphooligosaccharide-protein glycosyltransferase [Phakopsora pachyrhizi]CAH7690844.1 dolichyl-diphosphooligosaccharide-protein glycosyltransferase [Phakopsora pachyrhizi]
MSSRHTVYPLISLSPQASKNVLAFLRTVIVILIAGASVSSRLFAVIRHESIIHEFDPWFNFRASMILTQQGFYAFWNWFDETAWYPLGRVVGGTIYPGLMVTSGLIWNAFRLFNIPVDIRNVCVLLAPGFSGLTAYATYLFARELGQKTNSKGQAQTKTAGETGEGTGLWAALFIGIAPGYISRSVAGSYDNEAIAIFILMSTFCLWIKALKQGSAFYGSMTALFYFYMVAAWGGYAFITNMLPLHAFVLILMGRFTSKLYIAYSSFYAIGTLASMQVPFVGFQPIRTSEHMAALGVFGLLQLVAFVELVRSHVSSKQFKLLLQIGVASLTLVGFGALVLMTKKGWIAPWTGRFYSLFDTGYAKIHIPIIASVSEHQPTAWTSFFFDLQFLIYLFPAGVYLCFRELRDEHVFVIIYSVLASYFAGVMVRLMLTLTPIVCISAAMIVSSIFDAYLDPAQPVSVDFGTPSIASSLTSGSVTDTAPSSASSSGSGRKAKKGHSTASSISSVSSVASAKSSRSVASTTSSAYTNVPCIPAIWGIDTRFSMISVLTFFLLLFVLHCTWVTSTAYSSPSVVLASRNPDGSSNIIDDFREAYYWLRMNTKKNAKVMSWWDYGYQIAGMADRATLVDNNTWNNTHIATVGKAMSSKEEVSYPILRKHDVDYVLIIFGGLIGFSGDDINKFLWMVRIAEGVWPEEVKEGTFFSNRGEYRVDDEASSTMKNCLMYKMSYYNFNEMFGGQRGQDRVRGQSLPQVGPTLDTLEEAFTSENWIVRIYKVKDEDFLGRPHKEANSFNNGKRKKAGSSRKRKNRRKSTA